MTFVPSDLNVLNYPIETDEAKALWASKHKCNKMKAIIAFSLDEANANDNLRRYGYTRAWREKALANFKNFVNKPDCKGIPLTPLSTPWWECMPFDAVPVPPPPPPPAGKDWVMNFQGAGKVTIPEFVGPGKVSHKVIFDDIPGSTLNDPSNKTDTYFVVNDKKQFYWSNFSNVKIDGNPATWQMEVETGVEYTIEADLNDAKNITEISGYGGAFNLNGTVYDITLTKDDGTDTRIYTGVVTSDTKPTTTTLVDTGGGSQDGTLSNFTDAWKEKV